MRTRIFLPLVFAAVVLAGCGSSGSTAKSSDANGAKGGVTTAVPGGAPSGSAASGGTHGKVDCAAVKSAAGRMIVDVQLLAQLDSPESATSIKNHEIGNLDPDRFLADMTTLHQLDGISTPLGNPKDSIDFYETAAKAAKVLFASDPIDQAAVDTYVKQAGPTGSFLSHQTAISAAMESAHC